MGRFDHVQQDGEEPKKPANPSPEVEEFGFEHFYEQAERAHERGRFEVALRYYGRALERDRARHGAWCGQIRVLLDMNQPEEAETWLEQAARVIGESPAILALRSLAAARSGKGDDALAWSDRAMRDGMDEAEVWLARAEVLYLQGEDKLAGHTLNKAHERDPGPVTARRCGEIALAAGDLARSRSWLGRAERDQPDNPLIALRQGVYWERAGDLKRAEVEFSRALTLEPGMESAALALEEIRSRSGLDRAMAWFKRMRNA